MASNRDVSDFIGAYATYMELKGENAFRIRAYSNAARTLEFMEEPAVDLLAAGTLKDVKGIGGSMGDPSPRLPCVIMPLISSSE